MMSDICLASGATFPVYATLSQIPAFHEKNNNICILIKCGLHPDASACQQDGLHSTLGGPHATNWHFIPRA